MSNHESQTDQPSNTTRRKILKGSALALGAAAVTPATWKKPIVDKLIVPAHAQASIAAGVYSHPVDNPDGDDILVSWNWPGGTGPTPVSIFRGSTGSGDLVAADVTLVVAASFPGGNFEEDELDIVNPALPEGLFFYVDNEGLERVTAALFPD